MKIIRPLTALVLVFLAAPAFSQSAFNGTWRPDPQRADPGRPPDIFQLVGNAYSCLSCKPPYEIKADGHDQPVAGNERIDALRIVVIDEHTLRRVGTKGGRTAYESTVVVSQDGKSLTDRQIMNDAGPRPIDFTARMTRVAAGPPGSHRTSGSWKLLDADLTQHDEDTTFEVADGVVSMSDHMGRSFAARLDGADAPYRGDPQFTAVSLRLLDERTIEESDKKDGQVVKIARWAVDQDGQTIHVTFDDTHGHIQHQSGHRLGPSAAGK